jgi:hypothetical protein
LVDELVGVKVAARAFNPDSGGLTDMTAGGGERHRTHELALFDLGIDSKANTLAAVRAQ